MTPNKTPNSIVLTMRITRPEQYALPVEASGCALTATWFEGQPVTAVVDPAAQDLARMAYDLDDDGTTVSVAGDLVHWLALGWPQTWPPTGPRWAPVTPRPAAAHGRDGR